MLAERQKQKGVMRVVKAIDVNALTKSDVAYKDYLQQKHIYISGLAIIPTR